MFTAVLAARGFGLIEMSSGALLLPTGLSPTPEVFVFPKGFGCSGEELKFRCPLVVDGNIAPAANSLVGELPNECEQLNTTVVIGDPLTD